MNPQLEIPDMEILTSPGATWDDPLCQADQNEEVIAVAEKQLEELLLKYHQQF
jgi:hypothetical protein